jgi:hypothetical protein
MLLRAAHRCFRSARRPGIRCPSDVSERTAPYSAIVLVLTLCTFLSTELSAQSSTKLSTGFSTKLCIT